MSVESVWFSDRRGARLMRAALTPASVIFEALVGVRNRWYDQGMLPVVPSTVPVLSVGNISVGGTGKTPVTAYFAARLRALGRRPAIVMRGYGDDEPAVHRILNPDVPVVTDPDRARGISLAARAGADVVVLDDAFQHRRAARAVDVVLVSAERWRRGERVVPAGSLREPARSLRRASLVIVTHKGPPADRVRHVMEEIRVVAPGIPMAAMHLHVDELRPAGDSSTAFPEQPTLPVSALEGASVLAVAGVADPGAFLRQLAAVGARVTPVVFRDHHAYSSSDVADLIDRSNGHKYVVSTLKDAVKLRQSWAPKAPQLWYVSQAVAVSAESGLVDAAIQQLLPL